MKLLTAVGLIGIGYMAKDRVFYKPRYHQNGTLSQYLKNVAMDKMDILFYGMSGNRNRTPGSAPRYTYREVRPNYSDYISTRKENTDEDIE